MPLPFSRKANPFQLSLRDLQESSCSSCRLLPLSKENWRQGYCATESSRRKLMATKRVILASDRVDVKEKERETKSEKQGESGFLREKGRRQEVKVSHLAISLSVARFPSREPPDIVCLVSPGVDVGRKETRGSGRRSPSLRLSLTHSAVTRRLPSPTHFSLVPARESERER